MSNPAIGYTFAQARQKQRNSFNNPLGAYTPAAVRDAMTYASEGESAQQEAQALREEGVDLNQQEYAKRLALAELTKPQLVQKGGTTTQNQGLGSTLSGLATTALSF